MRCLKVEYLVTGLEVEYLVRGLEVKYLVDNERVGKEAGADGERGEGEEERCGEGPQTED